VFARGVRVPELEVRENRELIQNRRERTKRRRQVGDVALQGRRPCRRVHAHWDIDEAQTADRACHGLCDGGQRRNHRIEQWQRQRSTHSAKERTAWQSHLRDDHCDLLIWNGELVTIPSTSDENL